MDACDGARERGEGERRRRVGSGERLSEQALEAPEEFEFELNKGVGTVPRWG